MKGEMRSLGGVPISNQFFTYFFDPFGFFMFLIIHLRKKIGRRPGCRGGAPLMGPSLKLHGVLEFSHKIHRDSLGMNFICKLVSSNFGHELVRPAGVQGRSPAYEPTPNLEGV